MTRSAARVALLVAVLAAQAFGVADPTETFRRANDAYRHALYADAVRLYTDVLRKDGESANLYANLGNAYFKLGDLAHCILAWERALRLDPSDAAIRQNLLIARARTRDRVEPIPLLFVTRWWNDLKEYHALGTLVGWSIGAAWLLAAAAFVFFGFGSVPVRRAALFGGSLMAVVFAMSVLLVLDKREDLAAHRYAVITAVQTVARSTPDASGVDAFTVHEGLKVEILDERPGATNIRLADGKNGWIDSRSIERI